MNPFFYNIFNTFFTLKNNIQYSIQYNKHYIHSLINNNNMDLLLSGCCVTTNWTLLKRIQYIYDKIKFMKNLILLLIIITGITSCKQDEDQNTSISVKEKEFIFSLASSQQECDEALSFGVNCAQNIRFVDDTNATVMTTDIINIGTYVISGNSITIIFDSGDVESPLIFEINSNFTELTRKSDGSNHIWKLQREGISPWDL